MMTFPIPPNEHQRLAALHRLKILNTECTPEFDAVVNMAIAMFDAPIAMISFVDRNAQWFKAKQGIELATTKRSDAFCSHTIMQEGVLVVEDATKDQRFCYNDLVTGAPHIRFYAGIPISSDGETHVATLCVIDTKPRTFSNEQQRMLIELRNIVAGLIQAHAIANEAKTSERNARQRRKLLSQVERMSKIGAWSLDTQRLLTEWSPQVYVIHEYDGAEPPSLEEAISFYPEHERGRLTQKINMCIEYGVPYEIECDFITAKGNQRRVRSSGEIEHGEDGTKFLIGIVKDITEQSQQEEKLWRAAHLDSLTGIANRHSFHTEMQERIRARNCDSTELALLMIDLDDFKDINDSLGHVAGDVVLRTVAERISETISHNAFCARLGGDEFAVVLSSTPGRGAADEIGAKLLEEINRPIRFDRHDIRVGASIGIAVSTSGSEDDLFVRSDLALYHVKQNGRGAAVTYTPDITVAFEAKKRAVLMIKSAISDGRLEPHYQPIIDLKTQDLRGVEALVRVRNTDGTLSGPADFWAALGEPQCSREIDEVMLELALRDFSLWKLCGLGIEFVSVNASTSCIRSSSYADRVLSKLDEYGLDPSELKIEVVESVFLGSESHDVRAVLERLSAEGVRIALDDFGTGYASLSHLRDYPINCIKIDKSFVSGLGQSDSNAAIVQALIGLGRSMKLEVITEGIETQGQLDFVSALGSDFGQGYLLARPMDARALAQYATGSPLRHPAQHKRALPANA